VPDTRLDERFFDNPLVVNEPFIRFYAGQPLSDGKGHQIGTLCIADHRPRFLSERDLLLLCDLGAMVEREIGLMDAIRLQEALIEAEQRAIDAERARNEFLAELVTSQKRLASELAEAAAYVRSILPEPLRNGIVSHWCFEPCSQLGGDAFGYHWLSGDRLAIYLLDVCGHGIGSALLSVSAINSLRSQALPEADFDQPASVLAALNRAFPMAQQDNKFFTIWYGVFDRRSRTLDYGSAGHPAALLFEPSSPGPGTLLGMNSSMIGIDEESSFESRRVTAPPGSHLYVFSDGAFDLPDAGGERFGYENLAQYLRDQAGSPSPVVDRVAEHIKKLSGSATLPDDFSMIEFRL
jgi:sigma-B regulation protein RsbU (phosphoserine phosphatase)